MGKFKFIGSQTATFEFNQMRPLMLKIRKEVNAARYKRGFLLAKEGISIFPKNRFAKYEYAVMLGDSAEWASESEHKKNMKHAARILKALLKRSSGVDPRWVRVWKNEYYWFSRQPLKQYKLGLVEIKGGDRYGNYSVGVGAALVAKSKILRRENGARVWAEKSIAAWGKYFKIVPDYYNAYVWYAKALGFSGDIDAMEKALTKASKLSGRPLSYQEFADARKEVIGTLKKAAKKCEKRTKPKRR